MKISLVCSSGGHFFQLYSLKEFWSQYERSWVTFPGKDTQFLLHTEKVYWAYYPTNRNIKNFILNFFLALKHLRQEKPQVVISTGAGVSVPFIYMAKLSGIKTVYVESLTRINQLSLSAFLVYPVVDHLIVQWPELARKYKKAKFMGQVI